MCLLGFQTPLGIWVIIGIHCLPLWLYGDRCGLLSQSLGLTPWIQTVGTLVLAAGRLLGFVAEVRSHMLEFDFIQIYFILIYSHLLWLRKQMWIKGHLTNGPSNLLPSHIIMHITCEMWLYNLFLIPPSTSQQVWCIWVHIKHLTDDEIKESWKHCNQVVNLLWLN